MQENPHRIDRDGQVLRDFLVAPVLEAVQAEDLCLPRWNLSQGLAKLIGQLGSSAWRFGDNAASCNCSRPGPDF